MCDKLHFCKQCTNEEVRAWSAGEGHEVPLFGDQAQRRTAISRRVRLIFNLARAGNIDALVSFPEWQTTVRRLKAQGETDVNAIAAKVPETIRRPGHGSNRRSRLKYQKWKVRWSAPFGGAFNNLLKRLEWQVSDRVRAAENQPEQLSASPIPPLATPALGFYNAAAYAASQAQYVSAVY